MQLLQHIKVILAQHALEHNKYALNYREIITKIMRFKT